MVLVCKYCGKESGIEGRTLHKFPLKDANTLKLWLQNLNLGSTFLPTNNSRLCSDHFEKECMFKKDTRMMLHSGSVPSIFGVYKMTCAYCHATKGKDNRFSFRKFPMDNPNLLKKWVEAMKLQDYVPDKKSLLCSDHFDDNCFYTFPNKKYLRLKKTAVPSIFSKTDGEQLNKTSMTYLPLPRLLQENDNISKPLSESETKKRPASPSHIESSKHQKLNDAENDQHVIETTIIVKIEPEDYTYFAADDNLLDNKIDENEKMCRVCLSVMDKSDTMYSLSSLIDVGNRNIFVIDCLNLILKNKVDTDNKFPDNVCLACNERIISSYLLIEQWDKNQEKLKEMQNTKDNAVEIKEVLNPSEIECNYYDDNLYKLNTEQGESLNITESASIDKNNQTITMNDKKTPKVINCKECAVSIEISDLPKHLLKCKKTSLKPHTSKEKRKVFVCNYCDTLILPEEINAHSKICKKKQKKTETDQIEISNEEENKCTTTTNTKTQEIKNVGIQKKFVCGVCSTYFITKELLYKHYNEIHSVDFISHKNMNTCKYRNVE